MRGDAKAPSAGTRRRRALGLRGVMAVAAGLFIVAVCGAASASAACPNTVFRTGPSAKLPDCRAYELVSPRFAGGKEPSGIGFGAEYNQFPASMITPAGNDVVFNTQGGPIGDTPGNGGMDRYRSRRTAAGWITEFFGATGAQSPEGNYGGLSEDHNTYFMSTGNDSFIEPDAELQKRFGGRSAEYVRTPSGFQLLAEGSEGAFPKEESNGPFALSLGRYISPSGDHILFRSLAKLEPQAPPSGTEAVYDKTPSGTKVISLLPGNVPMTGNSQYLGASKDGSEVVWESSEYAAVGDFYVRLDNTSTQLVAPQNGVVVGQTLTCDGEGAGATYQWLRNGSAIAGATASAYPVTAADEGSQLQCQVTATDAGGTTLDISASKAVARFGNFVPPLLVGLSYIGVDARNIANFDGQTEVGQVYTCNAGLWQNDPTFSYEWLRDGVPIATGSTYTPVAADLESTLQCRVTGTNSGGTVVSISRAAVVVPQLPTASAAPTISDVTDPGSAPEVGDELTCSPGAWAHSPSLAYDWLRGGTSIAGAAGSTYAVVPADEGESVQCLVTATIGSLSNQAASDRLVVEPQPGTAVPAQTAAGSVFGSGRVGEGLSCEAGSWTGEPDFARQWLRDGTEIPGATEYSYTLTNADLGALIQCRITATNAAGSVIAINALREEFGSGPRYVIIAPPSAGASLPPGGLTYLGIFGGHVFYADTYMRYENDPWEKPSNLLDYDIATGTTTPVALTGDARAVNISADGSHVYFVSPSQINGEGTPGGPNLYAWSRVGNSTKFIAVLTEEDVASLGQNGQAGLTTWYFAIGGSGEYNINFNYGLMSDHSRSTPDGSVFVFESRAQLTQFNNDGHMEVYRYDTGTQAIDCVSCPPGVGIATANAMLVTLFSSGPLKTQLLGQNTYVQNVTDDGKTVVFESQEALLPQDGNGHKDVYKWTQGAGLALISTGQSVRDSQIYAMTPDASDIVFSTQEALVAEDENGDASRLYDAHVNGGFPPPESSVTERCSGDICQGASGAAPESPRMSSESLEGSGNVPAKRHCPKGKRARVLRHGKETCVRKHHRRHRHHHRSTGRRGADR